jgi:signal transduction histidine kinase/CheY-like chemotaxis protein
MTTSSPAALTIQPSSSLQRAETLFLDHQRAIHIRTDQMFAWLLILQWLGAVATAAWISPLAWSGTQSQIHVHLYAAVFLGIAIISLPIALAYWIPGRALTRHIIAVSQMLISALLIHLTGGRIETHFHVFGSLAFLAFYRDWRVLISASVVVGVDHLLRGIFWPESVFGIVVAGRWRWLEHVWWVVFEDVFLIMALRQSIQEMRAIAERQAHEERARQDAEDANKAKDDFLATLSHELRTPLTSAFGWVNILRRPNQDPATIEKGLKVLDRNIRSQKQLTDDLLDVSRIVSGKFMLNIQPMLLRPVLEGAIETARPSADAKSIQLIFDAKIADTVVRGDAERLQQVASNLLSNAVKFTPAGGRITLSAREEFGHVVIQVIDSGIGIPREFICHLFERFRQADASTTRRFGGLGLGLALVRHIVELHHGQVRAESEGEGQGTTLTVTLPVLRNAVIVRDLKPETASGIRRRSGVLDGLTVLLVEDEVDSRELIGLVLERSGARVLAAGSAADAMEMIELHNPDVMISDIGMPGEDGYSLIRRVRSREATHGGHLPAAALTAYAKREDRDAALAAGYQEHMPKPIEPDRLPAVIAELAGKRIG